MINPHPDRGHDPHPDGNAPEGDTNSEHQDREAHQEFHSVGSIRSNSSCHLFRIPGVLE
jgi:hypothetical protein